MEKYTPFYDGRHRICAAGTPLAGVEPYQYVFGRRDLFFAVRWIGKCKTPALKKKNGYTGSGNTQPAPGSDSDFMTLPEGSEEVPF